MSTVKQKPGGSFPKKASNNMTIYPVNAATAEDRV
jgi:hypothetical protein